MNLSKFDPYTQFVQSDGVLDADMNDSEVVLLQIEKGSYFGMSDVANAIWNHLKEPISIDALCNQLMGQYNVEASTCYADVSDFVAKLYSEGLVKVVD